MKKMLVFVVPVIIAGAIAGLGLAGIINIPGLTPKKKVTANLDTKVDKPKVKAKPRVEPEKAKIAGDPVKGYKTVAGLWNEMPTPKLVDITAKWREEDLSPILLRMEPEKVVEYLGLLKPEKAASLTKKIQQLAESG